MKLDAFVTLLSENHSAALHLMLPDGSFVPAHFHVTEVGRVQKDFVDCGGTIRSSAACVLQVWVAQDVDHRLDSTKLISILKLAEPLLKSNDLPVEVEFDAGVISQYPVSAGEITPSGVLLQLGTKHTACLAMDRCGIPQLNTISCVTPGCC
jgi:hypothetical protein